MTNRHTRPSVNEFLQQIQFHEPAHKNIANTQRTVIKAGPRAYKTASILQFQDPETGEIKSKQLQLQTYSFKVDTGVDFSTDGKQAHWSCQDEEIEQLKIFLNNYQQADTPGDHLVVKKTNSCIEELLEALGDQQLDSSQLIGLISALANRSSDLRKLPQIGELDNLRMVAAALRVAHRTNALKRLDDLIENDALEQGFQKLLEENWWMLGGQYVSMIPRREWTTDESLDLLLETADRYFEIIELKRSSAKLFVEDHGNWVVSGEVNRAVNQAAKYISEIEAERSNLLRRYEIDLYKLNAKVVIGHINDDSDADKKRESLRMYNSHLHRIKIISYDELSKIAYNVVNANLGESGQYESECKQIPAEEDIPF